jgi:type II secretory pathway component PulJ
MKRKVHKGFTLIELIIAAFTGSIVILGAGTILFFGQKTWNSTWQRASLQRDASYAMLRITRPLKSGRFAELKDGGDTLKIYRETDWINFSIDRANNNLNCTVEGASARTILKGIVEDLQFSITGNTVRIELRLREGNLQTHFVSTVMMRNYGQ